MDIRITKPLQGGTVRAVASKSEAHRLLICAALADKKTFINCPDRSEDIDATTRCLEALGSEVCYEQGGFFVTPGINKDQNKNIILDCGESGSTLRFLLPVCGALGLKTAFKMGGRLPARPITALYNEMTSHGCMLSEQGVSPLICDGQLKSGIYTLPGNISSQFVSGLFFALPLVDGESLICVTDMLESRPYTDMTLDTIRLFGINISEEENQVFRVQGGQIYNSPKTVQVGGDWSNAAFWLSAGAVIGQGSVTCTGLDQNSHQGDCAITELLARFGARVTCDGDSVTVSPDTLRGIEIDAGNIPDLVPILAAVASVAEGRTIIRNAGRLRIKESDRLHTVAETLSDLGADIKETNDGLAVAGKKILKGGETKSFGDHRIAMTAAVISAVCAEPVLITGAEAVNKSYPGFFKDFNVALNGKYEVL